MADSVTKRVDGKVEVKSGAVVAANTALAKSKGRKISSLSKAETDELLTAICQRLGLCDEAGNIK